MKTGLWFEIFCLFFNFLLDNSLGQRPCWIISWAMLDDLGSLDQWILPLGQWAFGSRRVEGMLNIFPLLSPPSPLWASVDVCPVKASIRGIAPQFTKYF